MGWVLNLMTALGFALIIGDVVFFQEIGFPAIWWVLLSGFLLLYIQLAIREFTPSPENHTFGDARYADAAQDASAMRELLTGEGLFLGMHKSSRSWMTLHYSGPRHVVTVAPSRTGKGVSVIVPNLLELGNRSVVVIDPKGENAAITARRRWAFGPVHLLNPFNEHEMGTARFNPLAHLSIRHPNIVADVSGLAEALIFPDGKDSHWTESARTLVRLILLHLVATRPGTATLVDLRRMLGQNSKDFSLMIFDMLHSNYGFIANPAAQFEHVTRETQSIVSTAQTQTAFLDDPNIAHVLSGSDFTMLELKEQPTSIFIILPSRFLVAYSRFFRLLVVSALDQLQSRPGGLRTTLFLDEFAALGHLSAIETAFGQAAGYRVQLWPFLQDLNQLKSIYNNRWETFLANAGVIQWFTPNDLFTADYLSRRMGQRTVSNTSTSTSETSNNASTSESVVGRPLATATELLGINPTSSVITLSGLSYPISASRIPYYWQSISIAGDRKGSQFLTQYFSQYVGQYDRNPFHG